MTINISAGIHPDLAAKYAATMADCPLCAEATKPATIDGHYGHHDAIETLVELGVDHRDPDNRYALDAFARYVDTVGATEDCFDQWDDTSLLVTDEEISAIAVASKPLVRITSVAPISDLARSYLALAGKWFRAITTLADELSRISLTVPDPYDQYVTAELRKAFTVRNKVLVSWARMTLGTAGFDPRDDGGYIETDGSSIYL